MTQFPRDFPSVSATGTHNYQRLFCSENAFCDGAILQYVLYPIISYWKVTGAPSDQRPDPLSRHPRGRLPHQGGGCEHFSCPKDRKLSPGPFFHFLSYSTYLVTDHFGVGRSINLPVLSCLMDRSICERIQNL